MITDYDLYFTPAAGQLFNAADNTAEYGSKVVPLGDSLAQGAQDVAVETDIVGMFRVVDANSNVGTSLEIAIVADDDGAGTNEITLCTRTVLVAALTTALGVRTIGKIPRAAAKKNLRAKVTTHGAAATAGLIAVWLQVGKDAVPANAAGSMI